MEFAVKPKKYKMVLIAFLVVFLTIIAVHQPTQADQPLNIKTKPANLNALTTTTIRYVATDGTDSGGCNTVLGRCRTLQYAIDAADPGDEIHVAGGSYAPGGTVARITQAVHITGGYSPDFTKADPEMYETVLDAGSNGSVVYIENAHSVTLKYLTLTHGDGSNSCDEDTGCGGGIYALYTELFIQQCRIIENVANSSGINYGLGGGVYARSNDQEVQIWGSNISNNIANTSEGAHSYSKGGGIYLQYGTAVLAQNRITENVGSSAGTGGFGGGVHIYQALQVEIVENQLENNSASTSLTNSGDGGGLYLFASNANVTSNWIEGNWTNPNHAGSGAGVYVSQSSVNFDRNTITGNKARKPGSGFGVCGGGIMVSYSQPVTMTNNLITLNPDGSGVYVTGADTFPSTAELVNNTIADNGPGGVGVGEYSTLSMTNNLIAGHNSGVLNYYPASSHVDADTNLFWNNDEPITGSNAILADPLLTPSYRLLPNSPAIDAGLTIPWLTVDLAGFSRPQGAAYDLGAFEMRYLRIFLPLAIKR
jgi:hypothetical protein